MSQHLRVVLAPLILLLGVGDVVVGKYVSGHLITHENWSFLDRFCFLSIDGSFEYQIEFEYDPENMGNVSLLLYPDLYWPNTYRNPKANSCGKKVKVLSLVDNQIVPLSQDYYGSGCEKVSHPKRDEFGNITYSSTLLCKNARGFRSIRERWWFISIASCNSKKGLDVKYTFYMRNGKPGDYWYEHFSADEFYILPILTAFCFSYLFLLFTAFIFAVELKCRQLFHTTYKLFLLSLFCQTFGILCLCVAYGNYASNGIGLPTVKLAGRVLEGGSEFIFVLLLLLLAKGYTVTRGRLRPASAVKLTIFNCTYVLCYALLFITEQYTFDPGEVLYMYESGAGYGILVLRLVGYLMFVYGIFFTLKHYPEKSSFYIPFFAIYSLWFISGPIVILISNYLIDKWVREKVAISIQHSIAFLGHIIFLGLTRPSAANKSFPYHVRTTQVGMMDNSCSGENYEIHSYAPSAPPPYDIFTVPEVIPRGLYAGPNFDVFNVSGAALPYAAPVIVEDPSSSLPALFPSLPPNKYDYTRGGNFPHQRPGQVEEMLKEESEDGGESSGDSDSGRSSAYRALHGGGDSSRPATVTATPSLNNNDRESKYIRYGQGKGDGVLA